LVRVDRWRQWLTGQVPIINPMTAYGNVLFASTTANRLTRITPTGSTRAPAGKTFIAATCRPGWLSSTECCSSATAENRLW
jgi:hypothetical protein